MQGRLRAGAKWLKEQHTLWVNDDPAAATDAEFSKALAGWDAMERVFRCSGYDGCIFAPDAACLQDAPVSCDACLHLVSARVAA